MLEPKNTEIAEPKLRDLRDPTAKEVVAMAAAKETRSKRPARASMAVNMKDGTTAELCTPHSDQDGAIVLLEDTLGTASSDFSLHALSQLTTTCHLRGTQVGEQALNAQLAFIGAVAPQNELEAALALQMAATHDLSMHLIGKAKHADRLDHMREYGNLATKAARTFSTQMKALSDLRRGGEQVVRHIHVHEGGQAVVAETINMRAQNEQAIDQCHALGTAMLGSDPLGNGMPITSGEWAQTVPDARRQEPGRAEGE